jgi:undecaprenyl-diphosphatase
MSAAVALLLAAVSGVVTWLVVRRWPSVDPSAPRLSTEHVRGARGFVQQRLDPSTATGLGLTVGLAVMLITGALLATLVAMVRDRTGFTRYDTGATRWGAQHASAMSTHILRLITFFGSTPGIVLVAVLGGLVAFLLVHSRVIPIFLVLVVVGQLVIANAIKYWVDRARPTLDPLTSFSGPSFPSGHATAAAATFAAVALLLGRRRRLSTKAILAGVAVGAAVAVAASRVLLGVHWLTDVVAGLTLGWSWFALCSVAFGGRLLRFGAPLDTKVPAGVR